VRDFLANAECQSLIFDDFLTSYMVLASQVLSLLIADYHFFLFFSRGRKDIKYLFFSLLCLSFFLAYTSVGFVYNSPYYTLVVKITRIFQLLSFPLFTAFMLESVGLFGDKKKYIIIGLLSYSVLCASYIAIQNTKQSVNATYSLMTNLNTIPILAGSIIILSYVVFFKKNIKVVPLFIIALTVAGSSLRDFWFWETA